MDLLRSIVRNQDQQKGFDDLFISVVLSQPGLVPGISDALQGVSLPSCRSDTSEAPVELQMAWHCKLVRLTTKMMLAATGKGEFRRRHVHECVFEIRNEGPKKKLQKVFLRKHFTR